MVVLRCVQGALHKLRLHAPGVQQSVDFFQALAQGQGINVPDDVSFPLALAAAIGLEPGEAVQWELLDRGELHLLRPNAPPPSTNSKARK